MPPEPPSATSGPKSKSADRKQSAAPDTFAILLDSFVLWETGKYWPVVAATLPISIPVIRGHQAVDGHLGLSSATVDWLTAAVLFLIALVQLYGQTRSERFRNLADAQISGISTGIEQQSAQLERISNGVGLIASYLAGGKQTKPKAARPGRSYIQGGENN